MLAALNAGNSYILAVVFVDGDVDAGGCFGGESGLRHRKQGQG